MEIVERNASETMTLPKSKWDISVDATTGVLTTIFEPNGTITASHGGHLHDATNQLLGVV